MSRIIKAIELAKQTRPQHQYANPATPIGSDIKYTHSKTVPVNHEHLRKNNLLIGLLNQHHIEAYKLLRTRVMRRMNQNNWVTLGVTSARENEGKSQTASNLAISIAMKLSYSVVLVDADLRRPSLHNLFGFQSKIGLIDYLVSGSNIEKMLVNPSIQNLLILPGRKSDSDRFSEHLSSPRMESLVKELKSRYSSRIVIFDLPPVLAGDDAIGFVPHLDATLMVVEDNKSQVGDLKQSIELLEDANIIGTILNKSSEHNKTYGYY